jgi:hypothetical protein
MKKEIKFDLSILGLVLIGVSGGFAWCMNANYKVMCANLILWAIFLTGAIRNAPTRK